MVVRAQPERAAFFKNAHELGAKFHIPEAIRFSVELNIVEAGVEDGWKDTLSVSHTYNAEMLRIFVRSLCIAK